MSAHKWSERATAALAVLMVLALVSMAAPIPVVHAATTRSITVHDIPDDSPGLGCTLREAIGVANAGGTGTVDGCTVTELGSGTPIAYAIYLPGGTYQYVLTGAAGEDGNASGDLDITANVNIRGWGAGSTVIDGGKIDRVFHICPGGGCTNTVIFTDVAISNGSSTGSGGGIYNTAGTVTIDGSTVSANTAASDGGGIYNETGTLTVQNVSTVSVNTAYDDGGGIYNADGFVMVDGSTVSGNMAVYDGGGICIKYSLGMLTVQNGSTVSVNTAGDGGGIYNGGTMTVDGSTVIDNSAAYEGGGIYNAYATTVNNSTVSTNSAANGGGIYDENGTLNVQNSSVIGGIGAGNAAANGGGIYSEGGGVTVYSSTVSANTAGFWGGGIYIFGGGTLNVQNSSVIGGAGAGNEAQEGGGIWNWDGTVTVDSSTISSNTATDDWGGGICNWQGSVTVDGSTVSFNTAVASYGGGIYNADGTVTVDGSTVSFNTAVASYGGGIYNADGTVTVDGSTISSNTASDGGGIYNEDGTTTVTGSRILNNTATNDGGGIFSGAAPIGATSVTGSCIVGNSDTAFFNDELAIQTATGNWWGAVSGPSGVGSGGGDSVSANVDYSGFLTEPILGCYRYVYLPLVVSSLP